MNAGIHLTDPDGPPSAGTWIEIDAACLRANLDALRAHIGPSELCMVVKGNAYGHGYDAIVPAAEAAGVRRFAVFSAREAAGFLAASDGRSRLMVMGPSEPDNLPWLLRHGVEPWINHEADWAHLQAAAQEADRPARVHLEVETGMNRTGLRTEAARRVAQAIADEPAVELEGVCTHLAGREAPENDPRTQDQKARFHAFMDDLDALGIRPATRHIASSASALLDDDCRLDLCRIGIACYGLWPSANVLRQVERSGSGLVLHNVLSWKSLVLAIKDVQDGDFVGYGQRFEAEGDTRVAIVGVGYGDGFARSLSNEGRVLLRGRRARILGNVNMSMVQVHCTHIPDAAVGDEVVLIGRQGDEDLSVASFSDFNNAVNYELMARLSREIPRIVLQPPTLAPPLE